MTGPARHLALEELHPAEWFSSSGLELCRDRCVCVLGQSDSQRRPERRHGRRSRIKGLHAGLRSIPHSLHIEILGYGYLQSRLCLQAFLCGRWLFSTYQPWRRLFPDSSLDPYEQRAVPSRPVLQPFFQRLETTYATSRPQSHLFAIITSFQRYLPLICLNTVYFWTVIPQFPQSCACSDRYPDTARCCARRSWRRLAVCAHFKKNNKTVCEL